MSIGTQPMPPSDMAMESRGNRKGTPDQSHSPAATSALTGNNVGRSSKGGPGEASGTQEEEPVWRHTTVPVSSHAAKSGSQWSLKMEGKPELGREFGKAHRPEAPGRIPFDFGDREVDVRQIRELEWDDAGGIRSRPDLVVPVVEGTQAGQAQLPVFGPGVDGAAESRDQGGEAQ